MTEEERVSLERTLLSEFDEFDKSPAVNAVLGYAPSNSSPPTNEDGWTAGVNMFFDDNPNLLSEWSLIGNVLH
jgi:hypothetical protein